GGKVVGIERSAEQLSRAWQLARDEGEEGLVDFRSGSADRPPLEENEWGTFDVAHARFVLEHVSDPESVVEAMFRAVRPGGRILLEDDDHDLLRIWPPEASVEQLWRAYALSYQHLGNDPWIGRRLVSLLQKVGAEPRRNDMLFFGSCAGNAVFDTMIDNFFGVVQSAEEAIIAGGDLDAEGVERGLEAFTRWRKKPDASLWYVTCWAEAVKPAAPESASLAEPTSTPATMEAEIRLRGDRRISPFRFLAESAQDLSSTLSLKEVFQRIARRVQSLLDTHLLCIMVWNESKQLLEHSYSLKFGQHIVQEGGFQLGYGLSGTAGKERCPIRVANVLEDPRYVRFRHAEVEIRSELALPLIHDGRLVGVLDLESTEFDAFSLEHEQILTALASHIASAMENARLFQQLRSKERQREIEIETARKVQRGLLPASVPRVAGLQVGAARVAARELSGDFYDFLPADPGGFGFALGDVAGKGTGAALLASVAVGGLRSQALKRWSRPKDILRDLNDEIYSLGIERRFVALVCGAYEGSTQRLRLSNAGLPPPLRWHQGKATTIELPGLPLGGLPDQMYQEALIDLQQGELVVFYSDGIEESRGPDGAVFGVRGITELLQDCADCSAQEVADDLVAAAESHAGALADLMDDRTVLVLKVD
ncbi:MAG: SpoIIE family protein phosphatase, partial [Thermoanaerobaculia bacterium]